MKPIRFLFFLYYYPPVLGTAPKRNYNISSALARKADMSFIFTATKEPLPPARSKITIKHIPAWDYRHLLRRKMKDGALPESGKQSWLAQSMVRLINTFPFSILIGEGGLWYYRHLVRDGQRIIRREGITHIYSSFRPFADHYAAYWLKKRNPELYWIADFRDLIIDPHYHHIFFPGAHQRLFKKIFSRADVLTTVSDGLAEPLRAYHSNVVTLRNGIEGEIRIPPSVPAPFFTIVYTGSMFLDKRNAQPLFIALRSLIDDGEVKSEHIQIIYAGKDGAYWREKADAFDLVARLVDKGIVSGVESNRLQQEACINVLLTISSGELQGVLTGKMIEYFQAGSPVLGIVVGQDDPELSAMLKELHIGRSFSDQPSDLPGIRAFLLEEYRHWQSTGMNRKAVDAEVLRRKYAMEEVIKVLEIPF